MAKNLESYEEDDFLMEDQNSNEEAIAEEDEEETGLKVKIRPARASLTHSAIKSEILKMNKQRQDSGEENNEENLSRSARKRKKRREKVLEERRASGGRGDNFEDDLAHFKSIPISRRRSSVLPLQTISLPNYNNDESSFCSMLKCCLWIILVGLILIGLVVVWPTVAELDLEIADQINSESNENRPIQSNQMANDEIDEGDQIINQLNKMNQELNENDNQDENNQNDEYSTFGYFSSFFASEQQPTEPTEDESNDNNDDANENNENDLNDEQRIEPTTDQIDEGFEDQVVVESNENDDDDQQVNAEENLADSIPERYQTVNQPDNLNDDENYGSCLIGDKIYNNIDNDRCNLLQQKQQELEQQLREQEQLIRQEQQENNNDEPFYFF